MAWLCRLAAWRGSAVVQFAVPVSVPMSARFCLTQVAMCRAVSAGWRNCGITATRDGGTRLHQAARRSRLACMSWSVLSDLPGGPPGLVIVHDDVGVIRRAGRGEVKLLGGDVAGAEAPLDFGGGSE